MIQLCYNLKKSFKKWVEALCECGVEWWFDWVGNLKSNVKLNTKLQFMLLSGVACGGGQGCIC